MDFSFSSFAFGAIVMAGWWVYQIVRTPKTDPPTPRSAIVGRAPQRHLERS